MTNQRPWGIKCQCSSGEAERKMRLYSQQKYRETGRESWPTVVVSALCDSVFHKSLPSATIMDESSWDTRKKPVALKVCVFNLQFSHFDPLSPCQCCNHVIVSTKRISTLEEKGGFGYRQKRWFFFFNYGRRPIESVCVAQMCQHFCPWLSEIAFQRK